MNSPSPIVTVPIRSLANACVTPHAAWSSPESVSNARRLAVETAMLYLREGKLRNLVNVPLGTVVLS
jgi:phosphoglycerate dehydrogenase-like enzyme